MTWILVTGGAKGLGRAICLELAKQGHSVVIHYRQSEKEALETKKNCQRLGVEAEIIQGDFLFIHDFLDRYLSTFKQTRGLVNNVGNYLIAPLEKTSEDQWFDLFSSNVHAPFLLMQNLLPALRENKGCVVNIGTCGLHAARAKVSAPAYACTKVALWNLTASFAKENASHFVRFNMVSPGYMENAVDLGNPQDLPMRRAATLEETARFVALLFDEKYSYITGQNIEIAGAVGL